jgi:hypothetical protein
MGNFAGKEMGEDGRGVNVDTKAEPGPPAQFQFQNYSPLAPGAASMPEGMDVEGHGIVGDPLDSEGKAATSARDTTELFLILATLTMCVPPRVSNSTELVPTVFRWEHGGRQVYITGTFNNWEHQLPMHRSGNDFTYIANLKKGKHAFKYIVDEEWRFAPDQPTVADIEGRINNFIDVSDFVAYTGDDTYLTHGPADSSDVFSQVSERACFFFRVKQLCWFRCDTGETRARRIHQRTSPSSSPPAPYHP